MEFPTLDLMRIDLEHIRKGDLILWVHKLNDDEFALKQYVASENKESWLSTGVHYVVKFAEDSTVEVPRMLIQNLREQVETHIDELGFTPLWSAADKVVRGSK